jgi:hypothetical protein
MRTGYIYSLLSDMADSYFFWGDKPDTDESAPNLSFRLLYFSHCGRKFVLFLWENRPFNAKNPRQTA